MNINKIQKFTKNKLKLYTQLKLYMLEKLLIKNF